MIFVMSMILVIEIMLRGPSHGFHLETFFKYTFFIDNNCGVESDITLYVTLLCSIKYATKVEKFFICFPLT